MEHKVKLLSLACATALLSACAANQQVGEAPWVVSPNMKVSSPDGGAKAMYQMGRYYQGQQRYSLAIDAYKKAVAIEPGYVEAHNGLGVIYARLAKYDEAIAALIRAQQHAPNAAHIYNNLGYAYYLQGQYQQAVVTLKQAVALDPSNQLAQTNLGLAYAKAGSHGESYTAFSEAEKIKENMARQTPPADAASESTSHEVGNNITTGANNVTEIKSAQTPDTTALPSPVSEPLPVKTAMQQEALQTLALPKTDGIVRRAPLPYSVPIVDSRVKLVQVAPNTYELVTDALSGMPTQMANAPEKPDLSHLRLEVSNGNGVTGMADKVSKFLVTQGFTTVRLTNKKPFNTGVSQIQYRDGYHSEALQLKDSLPESPELIESGDLRAGVDVKLLLGKDLAVQQAYFRGQPKPYTLALASSASKS